MGSLTKYVAEAMGKGSFRQAWAAGGWKVRALGARRRAALLGGGCACPAPRVVLQSTLLLAA